MEQLSYIHKINTLWRAISIHMWKTVLLLQQRTKQNNTLGAKTNQINVVRPLKILPLTDRKLTKLPLVKKSNPFL
jgi:hypothetical protein